MTCKCCTKKISLKARNTHYKGTIGVYECNHCGAIQGECYLGQSYTIVKPFFVKEDPPQERQKYFDLRCLGSEGITRRHGWFDTETGLITQVG